MDGTKEVVEIFCEALKPDPTLTVSQWADKYRVLSQKASAEPGPWRTSRTPFLKQIMDDLSVTSPVEEVVFMKGAQVGGTECGNNWLGYIIDYSPAPIICIQPTVEMAKRNSKQRIAPLIEECPRLKEKVRDSRSRDSGNTVLAKEFPGGILVMTGANSAVGLRSLPARDLFMDEIDAYPGDVDGEGDPVALAEARSRTFAKRKRLKVSTPTEEDRSRIEKAYNNSNQCHYHVPCPICGKYQWLKWSQVKWEKDKPLTAWYACEDCKGKIYNWQKTKMLKKGKWVADNPDADPKVTGYHLSSLYSPVGWISWGELAKTWVDAQGNREKLKTFINTVLGETWRERGDAPNWKRLYERRDLYSLNTVPDEVCLITAGADIQADRIEVEIVGWSRDLVSYSIDYRVFIGDTSSKSNEPWKQLDQLVHETWNRNGIDIPLKLLAVDSGYRTQVVYSWVRRYHILQVIAVKGNNNSPVMVNQPRSVDVMRNGKRVKTGLKLFSIGVNLIKTELYGFLRLERDDPDGGDPFGYCHFPEYDQEYFKQLTSEQIRVKIVKGYKKYEWEKMRDRNEALDCRVYARAAASVIGVDRYKDKHWTELENKTKAKKTLKNNKNVEKSVKKHKIKRRKSKFL